MLSTEQMSVLEYQCSLSGESIYDGLTYEEARTLLLAIREYYIEKRGYADTDGPDWPDIEERSKKNRRR